MKRVSRVVTEDSFWRFWMMHGAIFWHEAGSGLVLGFGLAIAEPRKRTHHLPAPSESLLLGNVSPPFFLGEYPGYSQKQNPTPNVLSSDARIL